MHTVVVWFQTLPLRLRHPIQKHMSTLLLQVLHTPANVLLFSYIHNVWTHSLISYSLELSLSVDYYAPVQLTLSCMVQGFVAMIHLWQSQVENEHYSVFY